MGIFDIFSTQDQRNAANSQIAGINSGYGQLADLYGQGRGALSGNFGTGANALQNNYAAALTPWMGVYNTGNAGTTALGNALGLNGAAGNAAATAAFQNNPGYQFQLQQGDNAINANAAATGSLNSGTTLKALSDYNQGLVGTSWQNYVSNLQPYLNTQATGAGGLANTYTGLGSNLAGLYTGLGTGLNQSLTTQGNAAYGANTSIGNANANADLAGLNASANIIGAGMNLGKGLMGFISDAKAKDDIEPVGELFDGQTVYRYRYHGDPRHQIGLIAQEVEHTAPDAVFDVTGDLKGVDYRRATDRAADLLKLATMSANDNLGGYDYAGDLMRMAA